MAEVTNELIYEVLKQMQGRMANLEDGLRDIKGELVGIRGHMLAMQSDIQNIYARLGSHDARLERIEVRLNLISEPAH
jgi:hypothetical protein